MESERELSVAMTARAAHMNRKVSVKLHRPTETKMAAGHLIKYMLSEKDGEACTEQSRETSITKAHVH